MATVGITIGITLLLLSNSFSGQGEDVPLMNSEFQRLLKISDIKVSGTEDLKYRFQIYKQNKQLVEEVNKKKLGYTLKLNNFALLSFDEFSSKVGLTKYGSGEKVEEEIMDNNLTAYSVDWRGKYDSTPVKNQTYTCNAGYAMAAAGAIESSIMKYRRQAVPLSSQQLIDCTIPFGNFACKGGYVSNSLDFIKQNGIGTENSYRYIGIPGYCKNVTSFGGIKGYILLQNEVQIMTALNSQPVILSFEYNMDLQHYSGGIYKNRFGCGQNLNHFGVGVGYVYETQNNSYWIVKNSFGTLWGERGYLRMDMYSCGIARNRFNVALME